ncbi:unnamed protein product, partial [Coccothraustes coccothraustes]
SPGPSASPASPKAHPVSPAEPLQLLLIAQNRETQRQTQQPRCASLAWGPGSQQPGQSTAAARPGPMASPPPARGFPGPSASPPSPKAHPEPPLSFPVNKEAAGPSPGPPSQPNQTKPNQTKPNQTKPSSPAAPRNQQPTPRPGPKARSARQKGA